MYKIKQTPEDFLVREVIDLKIDNSGPYSYFILKKRNYATLKAIELISKKLQIPLKNIGFSGAKDKSAITEQTISILNGSSNDLKFNDVELKFIGKGKEKITLGAHKENYFEIIVRDIEKKPKKIKEIVNYFDEQRFSNKNLKIGKAIIVGDFKNAINLIQETSYKKEAEEYLGKRPNDFVGAILKLPKSLLRFYINSYQSYLWNKTVCEYLKKIRYKKFKSKTFDFIFPTIKIKNTKIPLIGFATELREDEIGSIIKKIMKKEKIECRNFIIKSIPYLSSEGGIRNLIIKIKKLKIGKLEEDELNRGKKKVKLSFFLPKGSYATMAIKQLFA